MKRFLLIPQLAGILLLLLFVGHVNAAEDQAQHRIRVEIPEIIKLEMGSAEIAFDLARPQADQPFPAPVYPAYYTPTSTEQYLPVRIFANGRKEWRLLISGGTEQGLKEGAIEWSLDGVNWQPLRWTEQVVTTGGYTNGWMELQVYFRLVLHGFEYASPGQYKVQVNYQLSSV